MADFTAGRLERIAASAYDLVANAFLGEPSASGLQGQKLEPVCTEPFCGGLYWEQSGSWAPEDAPPLPAMPNLGAGEHAPGDVDAIAPRPKAPSQAVSDMFAAKQLEKIDLTGAKVYLPLDKPIATRVRLLPANKDEWQWWHAEHAKKVMLGMDATGQMNFVLSEKYREKLMDHLTPWLRLDADVVIAGQRIRQGSQLLTVKPFRKPLRVSPWIGSREQLRKDDFPLQMTFGMPRRPGSDFEAPEGGKEAPVPGPYDEPAGVESGKARPVGGPPSERLLEEPITVPVKRLDVVLRKTREGLADFLPPLLTAKEPEMEHPEEELA